MRYIYVILTVLILSSVCNAESSPNAPPAITLPASPNTPTVAQPTPPPATTQPATSHSDEATRIERDAYKQVVEAHQKTLEIIKWGIGIIGTLVLALMGYALFKDKKEYENALDQAKDARNDAKEACKEARQWERDAKGVLDNISTKANKELDKIREEGKKQIREMIAKAETERKISELWNEALRLPNESKYEETCEKYAEIIKLKPKDYWAYNNWGVALGELAILKSDKKLFEQAFQKYEQAIKIKPDMHEAYNNWGAALAGLARIKENEELFKDACGKFTKAIEINPDDHEAYNNWGTALSDLAKLKGNEELFKDACDKYAKAVEIKPDKYEAYCNWGGTLGHWAKIKLGTPQYENLLKQAEEKVLKAESLKKGEGAYNLACVYARRGNKEECKKWLLAGQGADTFATKDEAIKDGDLDSVRNEAWFKAIKWKGER
jgi:tetratricopeptide (TPR) repeat protein